MGEKGRTLTAFASGVLASLTLFVTAVQCRNDAGTNPFPDSAIDAPCEPSYACECCWAIGKVQVGAPFRPNTTCQFDDGLTDYAIRVTGTVIK